jgi:hypothetical protein
MHVDLLGYLHLVWGAFSLLTGVSLAVLALGTDAAAVELGSAGTPEQAAVLLFLAGAVALLGFGGSMVMVGRRLRQRRGRIAALVLAVPNLVIVPFGTALAIYTIWVLQNDDARRVFGHAPQGEPSRSTWTEID